MSQFWNLLLGITRPPGAEPAGSTRLELTGLPRGEWGVALALGAIALVALIWRLYRGERRELSRSRRVLLAGLGGVGRLGRATMLAEPVLVSGRRETLRSHLALVFDDSESLRF